MRKYSDELYHFGIKGMKWGIRRGRKSSGSSSRSRGGKKQLTPAERERRKKRLKKVAIGAALVGTAVGLHVADKHLHNKNMEALRKTADGFASYRKKLEGTKINREAVDKYATVAKNLRKTLGPDVSKSAMKRLKQNHRNHAQKAINQFNSAMENPFVASRLDKNGFVFYDSRDRDKKSLAPAFDSYGPKIRKVRRAIKSARRK